MNTTYYREFEIFTNCCISRIRNFMNNEVNITGDTEGTRKEQIRYYREVLDSLMSFNFENFEEHLSNKFTDITDITLSDMKREVFETLEQEIFNTYGQEVYDTFNRDNITDEQVCFLLKLHMNYNLMIYPYIELVLKDFYELYELF